jgi:hypothetical protein
MFIDRLIVKVWPAEGAGKSFSLDGGGNLPENSGKPLKGGRKMGKIQVERQPDSLKPFISSR